MRGELEGRQSDAREARDALKDLERDISDVNRRLHGLEAQAREAREALAQLGRQREARERSLAAGEAALGRLLAARAAAGGAPGTPDLLRVALSGEDLAGASRQLHYLGHLSRAAAEVIATHRAGLAELARLRADSEEKSRALAAIEASSRADRESLLQKRREHRRLVERLAGEIRQARRRIQGLVADESRLARLVEEIGKVLTVRPGAGFAAPRRGAEAPAGMEAVGRVFSSLKGQLAAPVRGEASRRTRSARGVFFRAPEGDPVRAVASGRVVYADWMRGFGNLLIVDHGESYLSIYGNNESLLKQTGDAVAPGEPVATVGASGGGEETGLYFEVRHLGRPVDPLGWLKVRP